MDSGTSSHTSTDPGNLSHLSCSSPSSHVIVGGDTRLPITGTGTKTLPTQPRPLSLQNVLISPKLISNLVFVRKFTTNNLCSVEFDPFGFSVKDLQTRHEILRCNSSDDLYPLQLPSSPRAFSTTTIWHCRLGHLGSPALSSLASSCAILCNKLDTATCQRVNLRNMFVSHFPLHCLAQQNHLK